MLDKSRWFKVFHIEGKTTLIYLFIRSSIGQKVYYYYSFDEIFGMFTIIRRITYERVLYLLIITFLFANILHSFI